jgi:hypothetical protein
MKKYLLLSVLFIICRSVLFAQQSEKLEGRYNLYRQDDPSEKAAEMTITSWKGEVFLIRGMGWIGQGEIKDNKGFYEWKFDDGRSGRTVIELNPDGTLTGHVAGSGINWKYIARKVKE